MKKLDWIIAILLILGAAVFFYRLGRRDEQYAALGTQVVGHDTRIAKVEDALARHESRWRTLNWFADKVRCFLPWSASKPI
jgi:hypothetical protein